MQIIEITKPAKPISIVRREAKFSEVKVRNFIHLLSQNHQANPTLN